MESIPMTLNGYNKLKEEIRYLKNIERPQIVEAIASARALGDLSENAEYHSAKERQGLVESRISDLEDKLSKAQVIDVSNIKSDLIKFGATVEIVDNDSDVSSKFQIVGSDEADIKNGLLPITSPIARALIGKKSDDTVEVNTPNGVKSYTILSVKYV
ncbi:MAG: transcription elongation factor GreA [Alphaproteobacteria bacterium]|nr:transcription elongation factor GreA [Alphaproteobacteria bacterium]